MDQLREEARKFRDAKEYNKAINIYEKVIENKNLDKWLGWEYADCLKKNNQIDKAICVAKQIYKNNTDFKYIKDLLAWTLYEKFFRSLDDKDISNDEIKRLCKIGSFILDITKHDKNLPYENTVYRIIKLLDRNSFSNEQDYYKSVYKWADKLDVNKLSKEPTRIKLRNNKNVEKASIFEEIIYLKVKCLFYMGKYKETEELGLFFISELEKFHNDRDKWAKRFIANCKWNLNDKNNSLILLKDIDRCFRNWIIKYELAQKEYELGNLEDALYHSIVGILGKEPLDKKKSLVKLQVKILYTLKKYDKSKFFNEFSRSIDNKSLDKKEINKMREECFAILENICERKKGVVVKILFNNKAGFINADGESLYFKKDNSFSENLRENDIVSFKVINSFDAKKNRESVEATDIILFK